MVSCLDRLFFEFFVVVASANLNFVTAVAVLFIVGLFILVTDRGVAGVIAVGGPSTAPVLVGFVHLTWYKSIRYALWTASSHRGVRSRSCDGQLSNRRVDRGWSLHQQNKAKTTWTDTMKKHHQRACATPPQFQARTSPLHTLKNKTRKEQI